MYSTTINGILSIYANTGADLDFLMGELHLKPLKFEHIFELS